MSSSELVYTSLYLPDDALVVQNIYQTFLLCLKIYQAYPKKSLINIAL